MFPERVLPFGRPFGIALALSLVTLPIPAYRFNRAYWPNRLEAAESPILRSRNNMRGTDRPPRCPRILTIFGQAAKIRALARADSPPESIGRYLAAGVTVNATRKVADSPDSSASGIS